MHEKYRFIISRLHKKIKNPFVRTSLKNVLNLQQKPGYNKTNYGKIYKTELYKISPSMKIVQVSIIFILKIMTLQTNRILPYSVLFD